MISRYSWQQLNPNDFPLKIVKTNMGNEVSVHSHDFHELVFFYHGSCVHHIIGDNSTTRSYAVTQGDVFAVRENERHSYDHGQGAVFYNIIFRSELISNELSELQEFPLWNQFFGDQCSVERMKGHLPPLLRQEVCSLIMQLDMELRQHGPGYNLVAKTLFLQILIKMLRTQMQPIVQLADTSVPQSILKIIGQIEDAPEKDYPLSKMAAQANMCVASFTRVFRRSSGQSFKEFIIMQRFRKAEILLKDRSIKLDALVAQCGFYDTNYFIKQFRKRYGMTPTRYRNTIESDNN